MKKRLLAALLPLILCGCSMREADDLSDVTAAALDKTSQGLRLTAELAVPTEEGSNPSGSLFPVQGDSLVQVLALSAGERTLYWSHATSMLLDEDCAKAGIRDLAHRLTDATEIRASLRLCVVRGGEAADVLTEGKAVDGTLVGFSLGDSLTNAVKGGAAVDMPLYRVLDQLESPGVEPCLPMLRLKGKTVQMNGTALLKNGALAGYLNREQTRILCLLQGSCRELLWPEDGRTLELQRIRVRISADTEENRPVYTIALRAQAASGNEETVQRGAEELAAQIRTLVQDLQNTGCDALGLGRQWYRMDPAGYETSPEVWQQATLHISVALQPTQSSEGGSE